MHIACVNFEGMLEECKNTMVETKLTDIGIAARNALTS